MSFNESSSRRESSKSLLEVISTSICARRAFSLQDSFAVSGANISDLFLYRATNYGRRIRLFVFSIISPSSEVGLEVLRATMLNSSLLLLLENSMFTELEVIY